jgi:hypothetical protein
MIYIIPLPRHYPTWYPPARSQDFCFTPPPYRCTTGFLCLLVRLFHYIAKKLAMSERPNYKKRSAPGSNEGYQNRNKSSFAGKSTQKREWRPTKPQPQPAWSKGKQAASKPYEKEVKETVVKRKRPVTQGGGSEEEMDDEDSPSDEEMDVDPAEQNGGEGEGPPEKRPKMSKAERAALHAAQPHRTALLPSHPLLHGTLLPLWETARKSDLGKEERKAAVKELWEAVQGRVGEVSRGHKGGRVLQTVCWNLIRYWSVSDGRLSSTEARRNDSVSRWSCNLNGER